MIGLPEKLLVYILNMCLVLAGILLFLQGSAPEARAEDNFMIKEHASVSDKYIHFADIADPVTQAGQQVWSEIKDQKLWKSPAEGRRVVINRGQLRRAMNKHAPKLADHCLYPREMVLQRGAGVLGREDLKEKLVKFLKPYVQEEGEKIDFREFRLPEAVYLSGSSSKVVLDKSSTDVEAGRNRVRIKVKDGYGNIRNTYSGSVFIDVWKTVPCTARPVNRRDPVTKDAIRFERKNMAYVNGKVWDGKKGKWMAARSMGKGQCLTMDRLEPLPVVKRGEEVDLRYDGKHIRLVVPVVVLSDAGAGDTVRVKNLQSNKKVTARVRDSETVVVR